MLERLKPEDTRDLIRLAGGLLLGLGILTLATRKEGDWESAILFLLYLVGAVILFGGGVLTHRDTGELRPWQAVFSVFGLAFVVLALFQFIDMIGGNPDAALNVFWVFAVAAALALYAGMEVGIRFQLLLAGLAFVISWMALADKIIGFVDNDLLFRFFLGLAAAIVLVVGVIIWRADRREGLWKFSELLTAAGIAAVISVGLGTGTIADQGSLTPFLTEPVSESHWYWDAALLAVSIALVAAGTLIRLRGPVYAGALGLFIFIGSVGSSGTGLALPLVLIAAGAAALWLSLTDFSLGNQPRQWLKQLSGHPVPQGRRKRS